MDVLRFSDGPVHSVVSEHGSKDPALYMAKVPDSPNYISSKYLETHCISNVTPLVSKFRFHIQANRDRPSWLELGITGQPAALVGSSVEQARATISDEGDIDEGEVKGKKERK